MSVIDDEAEERLERLPRGNRERVEFFRDVDGLWRFRYVAANNEIMAQGEGYQNHADALSAAEAIFKDVPWYESPRPTVWQPLAKP